MSCEKTAINRQLIYQAFTQGQLVVLPATREGNSDAEAVRSVFMSNEAQSILASAAEEGRSSLADLLKPGSSISPGIIGFGFNGLCCNFVVWR